MRIRIATYPPIPALKAWFGVEDHTNTGYTVLDLKKSLSLHLDVLQQLGSRHLLLELEGFELLDESLCYQVLREGDLISVKLSSPTLPHNKRKSAATPSEPTGEDRPVKRAKTTQQLAQDGNEDSSHSSSEESESTSESEKDSTSSSSSESSSSSSESTTESESESESGSASSTSRSSEPLSKQTTQLRQSLSSHPRSLISSRPTNERLSSSSKRGVPPGQGKASTQDRNRRRRLARKYKAASTGGSSVPSIIDAQQNTSQDHSGTSKPLAFTFTAPSLPPSVHPVQVQMQHEPLMMMSLKNSNKRKGYKERLSGSSGPTKLVFHEADGSSPLQLSPALEEQHVPLLASRPSGKVVSSLIPPSEQLDLPTNIFVTSVDVEADLWGQRIGTKGARKAVRGGVKDVNRRNDQKREPSRAANDALDDDILLDYGTPEDEDIPRKTSDRDPLNLDWDKIESDFGKLSSVDTASLSVGTTVAWRALGIDSSTLTPAMLLHVGEVTSISENEAIEVRLLRRPNSAKIVGFGLRLGQGEDPAEDQAEPEISTFTVEDARDWKSVQTPMKV